MKLPTLVMFLTWATAAAAAESPPTGARNSPASYAFRPLVEDYYPAASRDQKEQGMAVLKLCYDDQGRPSQVTVEKSSGFPRLDEAAVRWGKAVRIRPGLMDGQSHPDCVRAPVRFSLEKSREQPDQGEYLLPPVDVPPILIDIPPPPPPGTIPGYPGRFIPLRDETR